MTNASPRHPARYSKGMPERFAAILKRYDVKRLIDPFGGTGEIVAVLGHGYEGHVHYNELEREWAMVNAHRATRVIVGDAEDIDVPDDFYDGAVTSVTYGNRMADHHRARDKSKRNTYTHALGRTLSDGNTGAMHFTGKRRTSLDYCEKHHRCYVELRRILADGAIFVLNVSDHYRTDVRKGVKRCRKVRTTLWHRLTLQSLGFEVIEEHRITTPRLRHGANSEKRVGYESIIVFRLTKGDGK